MSSQGNGTPEEEVNDYYTSVCEGCSECIGADCTANGTGTLQCVPALENTMSVGVTVSGVPVTLETLELDVGYWRSLSNSTTVLPCWNTDACLGGITDTADFCAEGYRGPCELIRTYHIAKRMVANQSFRRNSCNISQRGRMVR